MWGVGFGAFGKDDECRCTGFEFSHASSWCKKVASTVIVGSCCLGVGEIVRHKNVLSEYNREANELVQRGIILYAILTSVLPLSFSSKRVTLLNVPLFIHDDVLIQALSL